MDRTATQFFPEIYFLEMLAGYTIRFREEQKCVGYAVCERERESTFSADDGGSWFGSVVCVVDPIWRFFRFPSETVIITSGWIVGQMSGTASLSSSLAGFEWSLTPRGCSNVFFSFLRRLAFNHFRDTPTDDLTNVIEANAPLLPPSLLASPNRPLHSLVRPFIDDRPSLYCR